MPQTAYTDPTTGQTVPAVANVDPSMTQQIFGLTNAPDPFAGLTPRQQADVKRYAPGRDLDLTQWAIDQLRKNPNSVMTPTGGVETFSAPGERSGVQFQRALNLGLLNDPSQVNLGDVNRYIMQGNGNPWESMPDQVRQRTEVMRQFLGLGAASQGQQAENRQMMTDIGRQSLAEKQQALAEKYKNWEMQDQRNKDALLRQLPVDATSLQARQFGESRNAAMEAMNGPAAPGSTASAAQAGKKEAVPRDLTEIIQMAPTAAVALQQIRAKYPAAWLQVNATKVRDALEAKYGQTLINNAIGFRSGATSTTLPFGEAMDSIWKSSNPTDEMLSNQLMRRLYGRQSWQQGY